MLRALLEDGMDDVLLACVEGIETAHGEFILIFVDRQYNLKK